MRLVLLLSASLIAASCASAPTPSESQRHPLLSGLTAPPTNFPRAAPALGDERPARPRLRENAAILWQGDAPFEGAIAAPAQVVTGDNVITITPRGAAPIEILYDLPNAMAPIQSFAGPADVALREATDASGLARTLVVRAGRRLILSQAALSAAAPIRVDLGQGLVLQQASAARLGEGPYAAAPLTLLERGRRLATLAVGQVTRVQTGSGLIQVYVSASHYYAPAPGEHSEVDAPIYVLDAWASGVARQ